MHIRCQTLFVPTWLLASFGLPTNAKRYDAIGLVRAEGGIFLVAFAALHDQNVLSRRRWTRHLNVFTMIGWDSQQSQTLAWIIRSQHTDSVLVCGICGILLTFGRSIDRYRTTIFLYRKLENHVGCAFSGFWVHCNRRCHSILCGQDVCTRIKGCCNLLFSYREKFLWCTCERVSDNLVWRGLP